MINYSIVMRSVNANPVIKVTVIKVIKVIKDFGFQNVPQNIPQHPSIL